MRTPKYEAKNRAIDWLNEYIIKNSNSKLPSTINILSKIHNLETKPLDTSSIESNSWFSGFSDADANFSINIHKRSNKNSTRVQLYYRLEIRQTYHKLDSDGKKVSFFSIMSILAQFLGVNVLSRTRIKDEKQYYSFTAMAHNKNSLCKVKGYFNKFPLLSSKFLDYNDWKEILNLFNPRFKYSQGNIDKVLDLKSKMNDNRTIFTWNHLNKFYIAA